MGGMTGQGPRRMLGLCAAILTAGALHWAEAVLAPVAFALFAIALAWPVHRAAQARVPQAAALLATVLVVLAVLVVLSLAIGWGFGRVARWVIAEAGQLQLLYARNLDWLEERGVATAALSEQFDTRQLVRIAQAVILQLQGVVSFLGLTLVFVILGLLEVEVTRRQLARLGRDRPALSALLRAAGRTAAKLRAYMLVRTVMSLATGLAVWAFAWLAGLELAAEWGVIAFVLNYIPFLGSLLATLFPTFFAALQFGTWQAAVAVFLALQAIQFLSGSYLEPRLAGARLALSPFMVLVAVFLGALLWGIPGAFIGVPALIAVLTLCEEFEGSRWVAELLSGRDPGEG
ncbi:AI-2E family transporter [Roseicella aerolata]|uniref:AI-2E family transporter n=1 Tax=Roseicella aerolata TaxID=2883479 RepID=A0A9X1IJZ9_9PROT|nr:AI-2E family transporter [Roseicella aerolata]MCB4824788.1 AI-2E family transporter [Roseicella aerolata]